MVDVYPHCFECRAAPLLSDGTKGDDGCKIPIVTWESYCRNLRIIEGDPLQHRNGMDTGTAMP